MIPIPHWCVFLVVKNGHRQKSRSSIPPKSSLAPKSPFLAPVRQRGFPRDAPFALRGADERWQSEAIADAKEQGWAG
jgi:hypothetical protein